MSLRNRLVLPVVFAALAVLAGCGGGSPTGMPPPTGGFNASDLNGTYVFSVSGSDSSGGFVAYAGTFMADGKGGILSGGVLDANGTNIVGLGQTVTGGSYTVGADGRPSSHGSVLTLQTSQGPYSFDFVMSSKEHGLITEFDANGSGSGTFDLQANVTQANIDGQSYAFNFVGTGGTTSSLCNTGLGPSVAPFATAGAITLDSSGNGTGVEDFNNNCSSGGVTGLTLLAASSVSLATVPGTAVLATSYGTFNFDVFPVDATQLKFIETDGNPVVSGDAFTQVSSIPSGNLVFSLAGFDNSLQVELPFATAGIFHTDGSGNITQSSVQDINDSVGTTEITTGITGTYGPVTGGRSLVTFNSGFVNGNDGVACSNCQFAAYPSSGGLLMLEIDNGGITAGAAYTQSTTTLDLATGQGYGMNLTGTNIQNVATGNIFEEDDIAEFTDTSGTLSPGIIDFNGSGSTSFNQAFSGTYAADSSVSGRGTVTPVKNAYLLVTYGVTSSTSVVVSTDPAFVGLGTIVEQNATAQSNAAASHLAVLRVSVARAHGALKKQK